VTTSRISAEEAAKLRNETVRIPDDPENYIISIDVFHQLHCLVRDYVLTFNVILLLPSLLISIKEHHPEKGLGCHS
jgi:tRNA uridine 5-carbamoylmethylation protein Kti12